MTTSSTTLTESAAPVEPAIETTFPTAVGDHASRRAGVLFGLAAYGWWGLVPTYFKVLAHVPASVVLAHRIVWSVGLLAIILWLTGQWSQVRDAAKDRHVRLWLAASTLLIATNWLVFIYSVATNRLVEASLGYFVNPLFTVVLGMVFLRERLRTAQWVAASIALAGLCYLTMAREGLPWIAMVLPVSFGLYSLIRKRARVGALAGLFIETAILAPMALGYLAWSHLHAEPQAAMNSVGTLLLLSLSGVITALPMLWFVGAARRLPLVTLGFMQYISPSLQLLTAVLFFSEPFGFERAIAFSCIWLAVSIFLLDSVRRAKRSSPYA